MLTGSVAMNYYAQPRMTRDIDLVVSLNETQAEAVFRLFEREYYLDRQSVAHAVSRRGMFNLIHNDAVIKVDCVVLKPNAYRQEEFARRRQINLGDFETWIVSREDSSFVQTGLGKGFKIRSAAERCPQSFKRRL